MKTVKRIFCIFYTLICMGCFGLVGTVAYYSAFLAGEYQTTADTPLSVKTLIPVTAEYENQIKDEPAVSLRAGTRQRVQLKMFGIIPIKTADVQVIDERNVVVLGIPFGVKMYTDGVLVSEITGVETSVGKVNPAREAGICAGDYIVSVDGQKVESNEELASIIASCGGKNLEVVFRRDGECRSTVLRPVFCENDGSYRAGIWVKDSSAGLGTLTFYSPSCQVVCGLGHGIYDIESKKLVDFSGGEMVSATVRSVKKGAIGAPGELEGKLGYKTIGKLLINCESGVYAAIGCEIDSQKTIPVALKQEVENGPASVIVTVDSGLPKTYSCQIRVKDSNVKKSVQNLMITVTDEDLLEKTGGIVQGMSGSPILQNGKLVGAVTHVLVDDPTTGYGIFAENMLKISESAKENRLAS